MVSTPGYLIVPGFGGSGPGHWQSHWERDLGPGATRIEPRSWDHPDLADWLLAISRAVRPGAIIVAHSIGCLAAAAWLTRHAGAGVTDGVAAAFLVAPADEHAAAFPAEAASFSTVRRRLPVPSVVIGSSDDPYCPAATLHGLAAAWQAPAIEVGPAGHLNTASGHGPWPGGRQLLTAFTAGVACRARP
jgi:predicted alpha/beta hydrolase family esterase